MIIGKNFVYYHIAKTGGDAVHQYFSAVPSLYESIDDVNLYSKHDNYKIRPVARENYVFSIRKLPSFYLSLLHEFELNSASKIDMIHTSKKITIKNMFDNACLMSLPDNMLSHFLDCLPNNSKITWLRQEKLLPDLLDFITNNIRKLSLNELEAIISVKTKNERTYDHDVSNWFTLEQINFFYKSNPVWTKIEKGLY